MTKKKWFTIKGRFATFKVKAYGRKEAMDILALKKNAGLARKMIKSGKLVITRKKETSKPWKT